MTGRPQFTRSLLSRCVHVMALVLALRAELLLAQGYSNDWGSPASNNSVQQADANDAPRDDRVLLSADYSQEWNEGDVRILLLRGNCEVRQGEASVRSGQMLIRRTPADEQTDQPERLELYLEDNVRFDRKGRTHTDSQLFLRLSSTTAPEVSIGSRQIDVPAEHDEFYRRAEARRLKQSQQRDIVQTQHVLPLPDDDPSELKIVQLDENPGALRRMRIFRRSQQSWTFDTRRSTDTTPPEQITFLTGGVQVLIDGVQIENDFLGSTSTIDLSADNVVIWTEASGEEGFKTEMFQTQDAPLQVYLEGNIIVRQGNHVIRAERAFYDARSQRALIVNAELRAFVPQLDGDVRLRAETLRQISPNYFHAQNAWTTTSQYGEPGYRFQASDVYLENRIEPWISGAPTKIDPETGAPMPNEMFWMTSTNNTFFLEDVPLLYTPIVAGPAEDPQWPIRRLTFSQDRVFGTQLATTWDAAQLFGVQTPDGIDWDLRADYYSDRGPLLGTSVDYRGWGIAGFDGQSRGKIFFDLLYDDGVDNLGRDRRALVPEDNLRGQALWRHRQPLPNEMLLMAELGYVSDRNFLEQYYESTFDNGKDYESLLYLKQDINNWSWSLLARPELNDFEASTQWLPKADLYSLSEPIFNSWLTWSSHSSVGYANIQQGDPPSDPSDLYTPIPYMPEVDGVVAMTRHGVDAPFSLGPVNFVPFAMGEAAFWGSDMTGDSLDRLVGQAGLRAHMSMWRLYPYVQSDIFNLTGLMHKIDFNAEYSFTDASENFSDIPQYNEFDENAQERFRRRLLVNTFGGALPMVPGYGVSPLDPRYYLIRSGAGSSVTAPYHELVDDLQVLRFSMRNRLQTKVGPPENMRIVDWMTFEAGASFFPNAEDDHFNETFGLIHGDYSWAISPRTKILAGGVFDLGDFGQQVWNVGVLSQRSQRGSMYVGYRNISAGPALDSRIITASWSYVMSPKWISTIGTAYDIGENRDRGQSLTITRVGEYALFHFGAGYDVGKGNASLSISIEPKFGRTDVSATQLGSLLGTR